MFRQPYIADTLVRTSVHKVNSSTEILNCEDYVEFGQS